MGQAADATVDRVHAWLAYSSVRLPGKIRSC
jgi:hypothetical protein